MFNKNRMKIIKFLIIPTLLVFFLLNSSQIINAQGWSGGGDTGGGGGGGGEGGFSSTYEEAQSEFYFEKTIPAQQVENFSEQGKKTVFKGTFDWDTFNNLLGSIGTAVLGLPPWLQAKLGIVNNGAVGSTTFLVDSLIDQPPVSTVEYVADLGNSLGIKSAYAQDLTGQDRLAPVLPIWKAFRNVSYMVFVLIFVIVGFMIMFRAKINPQTVITIESAIPNLIITLIIITFSYAIAGLMVDLIYVIMYLGINILEANNIIGTTPAGHDRIMQDFLGGSVIQIGTTGGFFGGKESIIGSASNAVGRITSDILWGMDSDGGPLTGGGVTQFITGNLAYAILAIAVLFSLFKLFFQLLMCYIGIILSVIFAPFQLLTNAFPGSNSLVNWLKGLLGNILPFPATVLLFLIAGALTQNAEWGAGQQVGFDSLAQNTGFPLLAGATPGAVQAFIGLGMIMISPKIVSMIKEALKIEKGAGMGAAIAPIVGIASIPGQAVQQGITIGQAKSYIMPSKDSTPSVTPGNP